MEDVYTLHAFARDYLQGRYLHVVLVEGNDSRLIDVGLLAKRRFPVGAVTIGRHATHPDSIHRTLRSRSHSSPRTCGLWTGSQIPLRHGPPSRTSRLPRRLHAPVKEAGEAARYEFFDHVWLSPFSLAGGASRRGAWIHRRTKHAGDASDHDPAWVGIRL